LGLCQIFVLNLGQWLTGWPTYGATWVMNRNPNE